MHQILQDNWHGVSIVILVLFLMFDPAVRYLMKGFITLYGAWITLHYIVTWVTP